MAVWLIKYHGTCCNGAEEFQHSLAVDDVGVLFNSADQAAEEAAQNIESTLPGSNALNVFPTTTAWTHVTAAQVNDLATGRLNAAFRRELAAPIVGAAPGTPPPQLAIAVSLRAGTYANGTPLRGRFYLPGPATGILGSDGRLSPINQQDLVNWAVAFIQAWDDNLSDRAAQVWSRGAVVGSNAKGMATTQTITEVRVGRVIDTIRSRRGDLNEEYIAANV